MKYIVYHIYINHTEKKKNGSDLCERILSK